MRDELPLFEENRYWSRCLGLAGQQWRQEYDQAFHAGGSLMKVKSFEIMPEVKQALGAFLRCVPEQVALPAFFQQA